MAMLGLALMWIYDLNLYTIAYLRAPVRSVCWNGAGSPSRLTAPLFALGARNERGWRIRLSRAATFQSLSLLAICAYFALMAILATALRGSGLDWSATLMVAVLAVMTVGAMVVIPSARARGWAEGQARQASVRASLRLSHRVAALHRDAGPIGPRRRGARRSGP